MKRKNSSKAYWEMTATELGEATKEFDEEFVADHAKPMTAEMKARWERAKAKLTRTRNGTSQETVVVHLDKSLVKRFTALAKKKRLSPDVLVARGLLALLAAEGE